jgi:hypothetical protein
MTMRPVKAQIDPNAGVAAGLAAIAAAFWHLHVVVLMIFAVLFALLDLHTGARRARIRKRLDLPGAFDRNVMDEGIITKFTVLGASVLVGVFADTLLMLGLDFFGSAAAAVFETWTPSLAVALLFFTAREAQSALQNIDETPGSEGAVWPGLRKIIDAIRLRATGSERLPEKRWTDDLTPEKRAEIERILSDS